MNRTAAVSGQRQKANTFGTNWSLKYKTRNYMFTPIPKAFLDLHTSAIERRSKVHAKKQSLALAHVKWYRRAADQGFEGAQLNLALMYENGEGVRQNYYRARYWYEKAAASGNVDARTRLESLPK